MSYVSTRGQLAVTQTAIDIPSDAPVQSLPAPGQSSPGAPPITVIQPSRPWVSLNLPDLWHYRELLYFLIWRDVKVRYKQTAIGALWAILQPFLTMVVFSVVFGRLLGVKSPNIPYPILLFAALLPWQLFANSLTQSAASLVANQSLVAKVYFPRLIVPAAAALSGLVDFAIASVILLGMMFYYGIAPTMAILAAPAFVLLTVVTALTVGLWLSAINVRYRDVRHTIPFLTQFWMFVSPVMYPLSIIPEKWRTLYALNPMVGAIEGFRWALLGNAYSPGPETVVSIFVVLALLIGGVVYFRRMEQTFADVV
ncbi:MAG: ABC transporter permease [Planctomycetes bacterium]|nr:ABC transporter permease [Planctomycetota bacterium]